ncbi:MAG: hypothetical protein MUF00_08735 [Gemmatimonadaceae bacterium]|jgi:hypothetical protein|nr:hypothetical protein [Gemmatimonadaceae bacterium]
MIIARRSRRLGLGPLLLSFVACTARDEGAPLTPPTAPVHTGAHSAVEPTLRHTDSSVIIAFRTAQYESSAHMTWGFAVSDTTFSRATPELMVDGVPATADALAALSPARALLTSVEFIRGRTHAHTAIHVGGRVVFHVRTGGTP